MKLFNFEIQNCGQILCVHIDKPYLLMPGHKIDYDCIVLSVGGWGKVIYVWYYKSNRDVFIIIVMVMSLLYKHDCIIRTTKNSALVAHFS